MKDAYYFSHDYHARHDPKLEALFLDHGLKGIGAFWCLVEMLYEEGGRVQLRCDRIAKAFREDEDFVKSVILDYGLFEHDDKTFYSISAIRRIEERIARSEKARTSAKQRWADDADAMRTHSDCNAMKGKERKGKEIKGKEI